MAELTMREEALERQLPLEQGAQRTGSPDPMQICDALPRGAALVDFFEHYTVEGPPRLGRPALAAFVVRAGDCGRVHRVALEQDSVAAAAKHHVRLLGAGSLTSRIDGAGRAVHAALWRPIEEAIGDAHTVFVVADGVVATVPLSGLPTDDGYLVDRHAFVHLDHPGDLLAGRPRRTRPAEALLVGDVAYGSAPEATLRATPCGTAASFGQLPGTRRELDLVASVLGGRGIRAVDLTGGAADERGVGDAMERHEWIHLATHGFYASGACRDALSTTAPSIAGYGADVIGYHPLLLSAIAVAPGSEGDGVLTAEEIALLDLEGADLVVLSSCESGRGTVPSGAGVLGLRSAFDAAGARSLLTSLWVVSDEHAPQVMAAFYRHLLAHPARGRGEALRQAQLEARERALASHGEARPDRWSGYVLSGAWR